MSIESQIGHPQQRDALIERLLNATSGVFDIFALYIGHRLGLYEALTANASLTSTELASRTGTHERYIREWLEQQTVTGGLRSRTRMRSPPCVGSASLRATRRSSRIRKA